MADGLETANLLPWQIHPALTQQRLEVVGAILWKTRHEVALTLDWDKGDDLWVGGCKTYKRSKKAFAKASVGEHKGWLSVDPANGHFIIKIGGVPCRFYRGRKGKPAPARYAEPNGAEREFLQLAFDLVDTPTPANVFRFEIQTDAQGFPVGVSLLQVDAEGNRHNPYAIAVAEESKKVKSLARRKQPVKLAPPMVASLNEEVVPVKKVQQAGDNAS